MMKIEKKEEALLKNKPQLCGNLFLGSNLKENIHHCGGGGLIFPFQIVPKWWGACQTWLQSWKIRYWPMLCSLAYPSKIMKQYSTMNSRAEGAGCTRVWPSDHTALVTCNIRERPWARCRPMGTLAPALPPPQLSRRPWASWTSVNRILPESSTRWSLQGLKLCKSNILENILEKLTLL